MSNNLLELTDYDLYNPVPIGPRGYIQLVDVYGDDGRVVNAARVSYKQEGQEVDDMKDENLIRYMMRHGHTSPFEQCEMTFLIQMPMDHWRQMIRHRTANVNEVSTRYTEAIDEIATTDHTKWRVQSKANKQGSGDFFDDTDGDFLSKQEEALHVHARQVYETRLKMGVANEQARKDLPLSTYTRAFWKCDLHNLLHFLGLRMEAHAQVEIREYATLIGKYVEHFFPWTWQAFMDYRFNAMTLTSPEIEAIRRYITVSAFTKELPETIDGMSAREEKEFVQKLNRLGVEV